MTMMIAGDAGRRSGGQGARRRALLPDLLCKALYIFLSLLKILLPRHHIFLYFNYYKFCYFRHFGHTGRASTDGRMVMATNGKVVMLEVRVANLFFPGLSKFIVALYSSVIQKKDMPL